MAEFDPYHRWLSISPEEQPPNHYRLLGVKPFESDPDAIESAADRQMTHVRSFQTGKHSAWSQKLLNELATAKICLLAPAQKAAYDRELRARFNAAAPPPPVKPEIGVARPLPMAKPLAVASPVPAGAASNSAAGPAGLDFDPLAQRGSVRRAKPQKSALPMPALIVAGAGFAVAGAAAWIVLGHRTGEPPDRKSQQVAASSAGSPSTTSATSTPAPLEGAARADRPMGLKHRASDAGTEPSETTPAEVVSVDETSLPPKQTSTPASPPTADAPEPTAPGNESPPAMDEPSAREPAVAIAGSDRHGDSALPAADELARIDREIKETFADDYARAKSREKKGSLARKLLIEARKTREPATRYGLLDQARQLAAAAGDYELALEAIVDLSAGYGVDGVALKCEALSAAVAGARGAQRTMLCGTAMSLVDESLDADHFHEAQSMAKLALSLARGTKDAALVKTATAVGKQANDLVSVYQNAHQALATLKTNPDDAEANLQAGKFLCLVKWDWPRGLPLLAKSSNPELRALAKRELEPPATPEAEADLADAWWDLAKRSRASEKFDLEQRGGHWYLRSVDRLSGVRKQAAERRIKELADKFPSEPAAPGSGSIRPLNEFAAKRAPSPDVPPGGYGAEKLKGMLDQFAPGFSLKGSSVIEIFAEHFGRRGVLQTHPISESEPATLSGTVKVPARMHTRLELSVSCVEGGDWDLIVMVGNQVVHKSTVNLQSGTNGWRDVTVDLTPFAGQTVELQLINHNTGWFKEWGFWDRIAIVTSR